MRGSDGTQSLLTKLKIQMTTFDSLPPMGVEGPDAVRERKLARDVMEVAVFLSARDGDSDAFQRHMAQVRGSRKGRRDGFSRQRVASFFWGMYLQILF